MMGAYKTATKYLEAGEDFLLMNKSSDFSHTFTTDLVILSQSSIAIFIASLKYFAH